jgi:AraC-like DNA-binding protein
VTSRPAAAHHLRDLPWLRRVRDRIDREYAQPLDVEALARGAHMSARAVRLGLGHTRDVSMVEGEVEVLEIDALAQQRVTGSSRAPASTRVRWPRRTAGSVSPRAASRLGTR